MKIIDWLLKKSIHHKSLVIDHKDHKKKTRDSFRRVKRDNMMIVQKLRQHENKIDNLQKTIEDIAETEHFKVKKPMKKVELGRE